VALSLCLNSGHVAENEPSLPAPPLPTLRFSIDLTCAIHTAKEQVIQDP